MRLAQPIEPKFYPRIWGSRDLSAWYSERGAEAEPLGEAWLSGDFPVLVKLLFPADRLSVQVHPDDVYAAAHGLGRGKTEMWYVLSATPEARLGVGLKTGISVEDLGEACRNGQGGEVLDWIPVHPGDLIFIPAGTVHAIGPGVTLCEVQQQSDNTFRLDDYGRLDATGKPRELHLEHGLKVARITNGGQVSHGLGLDLSGELLSCPYFRVWREVVKPGETARGGPGEHTLPDGPAGPRLLVNLTHESRAIEVQVEGQADGKRIQESTRLERGHAARLSPDTSAWEVQGPALLMEIASGHVATDR